MRTSQNFYTNACNVDVRLPAGWGSSQVSVALEKATRKSNADTERAQRVKPDMRADKPATIYPAWKFFQVYLRQDSNKIVICKL